ncbi:MAG: hypothetical protein ACFB00_05235 [Parvularculaceae bacterium]
MKRSTIAAAALAAGLFAAPANAAQFRADAVTFQQPDGSPAAGETVGKATLSRLPTGARLRVRTSGLQPGEAYSVWWVVFNNPGACAPTGCSASDFATPAVEASVLNATGRLARDDGSAAFAAFLPIGFIHSNPEVDPALVRHLFGPGLQNSYTSEIHVVVRSHGPANGQVDQISTFNGSCLNAPPALPCFDPQVVVFKPRRRAGD